MRKNINATVKLRTSMWREKPQGILQGYLNAWNISDPSWDRRQMDMKNIDRLAVWGECKKLQRQPTLIGKDLTLNSILNSSVESTGIVLSFHLFFLAFCDLIMWPITLKLEHQTDYILGSDPLPLPASFLYFACQGLWHHIVTVFNVAQKWP